MSRRTSSLLLSLIALAGVVSPLRALADPPRGDRGDQPYGNRSPQRADDPLSDSVRRIERSTRGQVLSAERMQSDGRDVNRIKVVDDRGRVRVYMDEPRGDGRQQPPTGPRGKPL